MYQPIRPATLPISLALLTLGVTSCFGPTDSGSEKPGAKGPSIRLVPVIQSTADDPLARRAASNTAVELESFQVAIGSILLARDITISGSAWNNPTATLPLFDTPNQEYYRSFTATNAMDPANDPYYIDFMTAAGLGRLSTSAKFRAENLGEYNFAIVNWAQPFRVRAHIALGDGQTVYTKPGAYDAAGRRTNASASMMSGPAETAVVMKDNGGAWFRFLHPLTITASDLNTTELVHDTTYRDSLGNFIDTLVPAGQLSILMVFNPDEFLTAWDSTNDAGGGNAMGDITGPNAMGNIQVPYLDATAVPYRQGEEVWRETYVFTGATTDRGGVRTRLELYTIGDNIVAASLRGLVGPAGELPFQPEQIFFVVDGTGGTITAQTHDRSAILENFHRLATVGAAGTNDLRLGHFTLTAAAYTLREKRKMN